MATNSTSSATDSLTSSESTSSSVILTTSSSILSTSSTPITSSTTTSATPSSTSSILSTTSSTPSSTSTLTATSSRAASVTTVYSTVTQPGQVTPSVFTIVLTTTSLAGSPSSDTTSAAPSTTSTSPGLNNGSSGDSNGTSSKGLSSGATTGIAVAIPVVVVAALVVLGIFLWRRRKRSKEAEETRRREIQDYGYNPNNDPTIPAVASDTATEMGEDNRSGYRGWGTAIGSGGKASTTLSGGHTHGQLSDVGSQGGYPQHQSSTGSDGHSGDALMQNQRDTMGSDELGALGAAPAAGAAGIRRGVSNASSAYSNGARSDGSEEPMPSLSNNNAGPIPSAYEYNAYNGSYNQQAGYGQHGPYGDGSYGGGAQENGMPVVRDVSARRNTQIRPGGNYQQGNTGIAQNF